MKSGLKITAKIGRSTSISPRLAIPICQVSSSSTSRGRTTLLILTLLQALHDSLEPAGDHDEVALVERARKLDNAAWQVIYDRYYSRLYGYLYYRVGDADLAEELTAQVFERAVKHIGRYRHQGSGLGAWLNRIAQNLANDVYRRRKARPPEPLELQEAWIDSGDDPAAAAIQQESYRYLHAALARLTPDQREVILLRFVARMTSPEIGRRLGKTTGAVKALQHRALAALRRELEALNYHGLP
ncbi:MAG: sigma-70 family RNA polymerase sigma factor [Caldilineae bacterium]|nr:MAG: sigma-70 family RNA polymerase sigma factor [Caldilineae bacterium]